MNAHPTPRTLKSVLEDTVGIIVAEAIDNRLPHLSQVLCKRVDECNNEGQKVILLTVGRGADYFCGLVRTRQTILAQTENIFVRSYGSDNRKQEKHEVRFCTVDEDDDKRNFKDAVVIVQDDILDTGETAAFLRQWLLKRGAASVEFVFLIRKPSNVTVRDLKILAVGFDIPDIFVYGVGMDAYGFEELRGIRSLSCLQEELPEEGPYYWIPAAA